MTPEEVFLQLIEAMLKKIPVSVTIGTVEEIDKEKRSITVKREGKPTLYNVRLNSVIADHTDHLTVFPKKGTYALCLMLGDPTNYFVLAIAEPEEVVIKIGSSTLTANNKDGWVFNDGKLNGLVKIDDLINKLNVLENRMTSHQHLYTPAGSSSPVPTTTDVATNAKITPTQRTELENKKIKQ